MSGSIEPLTSNPINAKETFEVYLKVQAAMIKRYGKSFVHNLPNKTGFKMWWFLKIGGKGDIDVWITPNGVLRIEFSRNLGKDICEKVPPSKTLITTSIAKMLLTDDKADAFIYAKMCVREKEPYSAVHCESLAMALLQTLLQG